jgi:GxxExxY protein
MELTARIIPFESQKELRIYYKRQRLKKSYTADFLIVGKIIVEIKALERLTSTDEAQLLNYLKATKLQVGVLINFGAAGKLEWIRRVRTGLSEDKKD